jgi:glycine/D-amino acid oxidase-like deaminating enzyme
VTAHPDVLVIGAGAIGVAAALELVKAGAEVVACRRARSGRRRVLVRQYRTDHAEPLRPSRPAPEPVDSLDAVRGYAGQPVDRAGRCPQDERYLVDREPTVTNFDVVVP